MIERQNIAVCTTTMEWEPMNDAIETSGIRVEDSMLDGVVLNR
jgi:hypothetical protein